MSTHQCS